MKKIIAAFDGLSFSESTKEYAIYIAKHANAHLVGVFLEDVTRHSYGLAEITEYEGPFEEHVEELNQKDKEDRDEAVSQFERDCQSAGINYSVHRDKNIALHDVLHESIYADLLIIDSKETMTRFDEKPPSRFLTDLLVDVQCPMLVVPSKFKDIEKVIILFDGEPSSVHAVKMFSYMLPSLKQLETEVLSVKHGEDSLHLPDNKLMKEFMRRHFPAAEYIVLKGLPEEKILNYLSSQKEQPLVVLGAYRRGLVSRWFRASMADVLMNKLKVPLFIAHNKG